MWLGAGTSPAARANGSRLYMLHAQRHRETKNRHTGMAQAEMTE